ncbi:MAG: radical SAM protein, partial [Clostridia bacterium]|nr:radical SAM protein [Clostridia bacterium]
MDKKRHVNIPVFIPQKGCPQACVFCNQRRISGTQRAPDLARVRLIIEEQLTTLSAGDEVEIAYFGGSFTCIPREEMMQYLSLAHTYVQAGLVKGIRLSTRPDGISEDIMSILKAYGVTTVELGVQSLDNEILRISKRGHTITDSVKACRLIKESDIKLGIQTMIGLPGDTLAKALNTAEQVLRLGPDMVRIYPALVLSGTELEEMYIKLSLIHI